MKPLIGISTSQEKGDNPDSFYSSKMYTRAVIAAGGIPFILPILDDPDLIEMVTDKLDGLLLAGGVDVDPILYNEEPHPKLGRIDPQRDFFETTLVKGMYERRKAMFGICRGCQIITTSLGGSLYQDIPSQYKDKIKHSQEAPRWYPTHAVRISKNGNFSKVFKGDVAYVNSFHHQSIKKLAPDFMVAAEASDGVIEAIEHTKHNLVFGVQWHPEHLWQHSEETLNLFKYFIAQTQKV